MSEHIKTGAEIWNMLETASMDEDLKWVSLSWLKKEIKQKNDYFMNLPGDLKDIRDLGRMDICRWLLTLLEEK